MWHSTTVCFVHSNPKLYKAAFQKPVWNTVGPYVVSFLYIPYDSLSSYHIQICIGSPKRHLFDRQFCVGLLQTFCKQWPKGPGKIPKFWPLHSVRQNVAGFRRGLFTCFLGHTPFLQYYLLFGPHPFITVIKNSLLNIGPCLAIPAVPPRFPPPPPYPPPPHHTWHSNCNQQCSHWFFITVIRVCGPKSR